MTELKDDSCVEVIRKFVRTNPDIDVYDYIKRGCNGEVYFGRRKKMGDDVVLKFYWAFSNYDATEEAVILQKISHKNIIKIYDLRFLPPNYAFFLMPKITGGDLLGIIDTKNYSTKEALNIITNILLGLTELHSAHKLVHRDLKPGNILINLSDNRPIIADLGAVKKIDVADGHVTASKATYLYLPPEAIERNEYYFQSDIYQVGLIMFQLLGGFFPINEPEKWLSHKEKNQINEVKDPFIRKDKLEEFVGNKILKGKIADTNTLPYYLDSAYKRVIKKALNLDYRKRYENTSLFLKEVHNLLRSFPDYKEKTNELSVKHDSGKQYKIYENQKCEIVLEKKPLNKDWRKDNSHNGTIESALSIARKN